MYIMTLEIDLVIFFLSVSLFGDWSLLHVLRYVLKGIYLLLDNVGADKKASKVIGENMYIFFSVSFIYVQFSLVRGA